MRDAARLKGRAVFRYVRTTGACDSEKRLGFCDAKLNPLIGAPSAEKFLRGKKLAAPGNRMVIISGVRMGHALIDSIQLRAVKMIAPAPL